MCSNTSEERGCTLLKCAQPTFEEGLDLLLPLLATFGHFGLKMQFCYQWALSNHFRLYLIVCHAVPRRATRGAHGAPRGTARAARTAQHMVQKHPHCMSQLGGSGSRFLHGLTRMLWGMGVFVSCETTAKVTVVIGTVEFRLRVPPALDMPYGFFFETKI